jgi:hypothetical protein
MGVGKNHSPRVGKLFPHPDDHCRKDFHEKWKKISSMPGILVHEMGIALGIGSNHGTRSFGILIAKDCMAPRTICLN